MFGIPCETQSILSHYFKRTIKWLNFPASLDSVDYQ